MVNFQRWNIFNDINHCNHGKHNDYGFINVNDYFNINIKIYSYAGDF